MAPPKWEIQTKERLKSALKKYRKPLQEIVNRDANEGDTRLLITDMLCDGFGFDKYTELTTEYRTGGEYADFGLRLDQELVAFLEVKRATTKLTVKHLRQVEMYSVNEGVEWMILTNGSNWRVYRLSLDGQAVIDLVIDVDLLDGESSKRAVDELFHITRESLKHRRIDEHWKATSAKSAKSLAGVLLSDDVCRAVRRELKKRTGHNADANEIQEIIRTSVVRPELL